MDLISLLPAASFTAEAATALVPAAFDIESLFTNGEELARKLGGAFLGLLGTISVICSVVFAFGKLVSEQSRRSWLIIIVLFILGGVMLAGSISMFVDIAKGTKTTIDQLGTGAVLLGILR